MRSMGNRVLVVVEVLHEAVRSSAKLKQSLSLSGGISHSLQVGLGKKRTLAQHTRFIQSRASMDPEFLE